MQASISSPYEPELYLDYVIVGSSNTSETPTPFSRSWVVTSVQPDGDTICERALIKTFLIIYWASKHTTLSGDHICGYGKWRSRGYWATQCLGYTWATHPQGHINSGDWPSRLGVGRKASDLSLENPLLWNFKQQWLVWESQNPQRVVVIMEEEEEEKERRTAQRRLLYFSGKSWDRTRDLLNTRLIHRPWEKAFYVSGRSWDLLSTKLVRYSHLGNSPAIYKVQSSNSGFVSVILSIINQSVQTFVGLHVKCPLLL
jgi:hypothetical protein